MVYLFEKFELDDSDFCLFHEGRRVPLEPRALRVLLLFVQNPGKLLQKDFILESVWKATFVEESTLTRAITILRKQLGDDSRASTYIQTVPTLGYRFIAKVETLSAVGTRETHPAAKPVATVREVLTSNSLSRRHEGRSLKWRIWYLLAILLPVAGGAALWLHSHQRPILEEKKAVVLSDFENSTGDAVFDGTLREGLTVQLEQSPVLSLVSEPRIRNTLRMMSLNPETRLTPMLAREICQRTDSAAIV